MTTDSAAPDNVLQTLQTVIDQAGPLRRHRPTRYDPGHVFDVAVTGVCPSGSGRARMIVEKFVGGGFAGQVYRVRLEALDVTEGQIAGLDVGGRYAVKVIIPPSRFSLAFRNTVYALAYQGPFSAQVHPAAARSGVLWQKLIRRAAAIEFDCESTVCDTHATFYDDGLGSWGEINEWVEGRNWQFELDDRYFDRQTPDPEDPHPDFAATGAAEYFAKKHFMARFVTLLHRIGAPEFARQYQWWTAKSQPNVLKRLDAGRGPSDGLTAIDFRAGLALLPFLPMSPADVPLIWRGLKRGALVQFDRGDLGQLEAYIDEHAERFDNLRPALEELKATDPAYRRTLIDVTHHGLRPLWDSTLRRSIAEGFILNWKAKHLLDDTRVETLRRSRLSFAAFFLASLAPVVAGLGILVAAIPIWRQMFDGWGLLPDGPWWQLALAGVGAGIATLVALKLTGGLFRVLRRLWGDRFYRLHVGAMLRKPAYLVRALHARQAEILLTWHRVGRRSPEAIARMATSALRFWPQAWLMGWMPVRWHRFLIEPRGFAWPSLVRTVGGAILFIKDAAFRQKWLEDIIDEGHADGTLSDAEHAELRPKAADPYIKTYLLCLAGHIATLPVSQVVAIVFAFGWTTYDGWAWDTFIKYSAISLVVVQSIPISPGSICRGLIVIAVMIRERNFKDFRVAAALSMVKYLGYLSFPIQMATKYPVLARLMAGRWATGAVRFVPVFGEHGALMEHAVLDLCFNEPVSIRRRIADGKETAARLVAKMLLAGAWFVLTAVAALLAWKARGPAAEGTLEAMSLLPLWIVTGLASVAVLSWAMLAPSFGRIRRFGWLILLPLALLPAGLVVWANWTLLFG